METNELAEKLISQGRLNTQDKEQAITFVNESTPEFRQQLIELASTPIDNGNTSHQSSTNTAQQAPLQQQLQHQVLKLRHRTQILQLNQTFKLKKETLKEQQQLHIAHLEA